MTVRELDRMVSKTELTPATKKVLRVVRTATIKGRVQGPFETRYAWSVTVDDACGKGARFSFRIRRAA